MTLDEVYDDDIRALAGQAASDLGYYLQPGAAGPGEAFAEPFAQVHGGGASHLDLTRTFPAAAAHIRRLVR